MQAKLKELANKMPLIVEKLAEVGINTLDAEMRNRIFEESMAVNEPIKKGEPYVKAYAKVRAKAGRQTRRIDLQFSGDMLRSIKKIKTSTGEALIFNNQNSANIARGLQERWGQTIFEPNESERTQTINIIQDTFKEIINEIFKTA